MSSILVLFLLIVGAACDLRRKDQMVKTHQPGEPVLYPLDFCPDLQENDVFDYIIVGAGPAGAPIARRLAEDPSVTVLVLEAGGDPPPESDIPANYNTSKVPLWNITTEEKENQCLGMGAGVCRYLYPMVLGGASVTNAMMYLRGNHEDYKEWKEEGCPGWGWKDIFPYFKKLENYENKNAKVDMKYHRKGGPFTTASAPLDPQIEPFKRVLIEALARNQIPHTKDPNGERQTGYGEITASIDTVGYRNNVAKAYLLNIPDNLKICKHSLVYKLEISNDKAVTGVDFVYNGTRKMVAKAKEYILAAGPISSPQILERSGVGRKDVLEKAGVKLIHELNGVGENLQEQFSNMGCAFAVQLNTQAAPNPLSLSLLYLTVFLNNSDFSKSVPDTQYIIEPAVYKDFWYKDQIVKQYDARNTYILSGGNIILRQSKPGYVHITGTNPLHSPRFQPNQYTSDDEKKLLGSGCRLMRQVLNDTVLADFDVEPIVLNECKDYEFNSDEEILCHAGITAYPMYHLAGSTKMGDDEMSVVDTQMRVHGIKNLRIVDLGIMPKVPRSNTEIPTIAVSEMAADVIKNGQIASRTLTMRTFFEKLLELFN